MTDAGSLLAGDSRYQQVGTLGSGAFSTVVRARDRQTGEEVAVKLIQRGSLVADRRLYVKREVAYLAGLSSHPCIVSAHEAFLTSTHLCIAMELVEGGTLFHWVLGQGARERPPLSVADARWLFQMLIIGLDFMHRRGVANRDVKLENLLVDSKTAQRPLLKVCDLSYSKHDADSAAQTMVGTAAYLAPEVVRWSEHYDAKKVDVWGAGIVLYVLLYGQLPFEPSRPDIFAEHDERRRPPPPDRQVDAGAEELLAIMLARHPAQRPTMQQIIDHPWFQADLPPGALTLNDELLTRTVDDPSLADRVSALVDAACYTGTDHHLPDRMTVNLRAGLAPP
ncbi:sulfur stress regulator [Chlorella sorokiniana]|uniref:Sulfur stress regulator n=1 Tax=Chlorella sorokiniana TaxID=3076 RepID=A0A2P6TDT9_CHLSO|nr:sulfur stress regulator [Chlorella sorokiniana]|eukprot:PRW20807.1 sulfur stress regulator [Chlorella sorokiniana]